MGRRQEPTLGLSEAASETPGPEQLEQADLFADSSGDGGPSSRASTVVQEAPLLGLRVAAACCVLTWLSRLCVHTHTKII